VDTTGESFVAEGEWEKMSRSRLQVVKVDVWTAAKFRPMLRRLRKSGVRSGKERGCCAELETSHEVKRYKHSRASLGVRPENTVRRRSKGADRPSELGF
jgi:hypothetical protein